MQYLDDPQDLFKILLVSKQWNTKFSRHIPKKILSGTREPSQRQRRELYRSLLQVVNLS